MEQELLLSEWNKNCYFWNGTRIVTFGMEQELLLLEWNKNCYFGNGTRIVTFGMEQELLLWEWNKNCYFWNGTRIVTFGMQQELRWIFEHETTKLILYFVVNLGGTLCRCWLKHCATNQNVGCSIPVGVNGIFFCNKPSGLTLALGGPLSLYQKWIPGIFPGG